MSKQILLIANETRDTENKVTRKALEILSKAGMVVYAYEELRQRIPEYEMKAAECVDLETLDAGLVLGGDGTLLNNVRRMNWAKLPLLAVNIGHLGYLTQGGPEILEEAVQRLADKDYRPENRIYLFGHVIRDGKEVFEFSGLNEMTLHRGATEKMIQYNVNVNQYLIYTVLADGVMVATPTGSTAYNLSAGGPILAPTAKNLIITPICAHSMGDRPIVTAPEDVIDIEILSDCTPLLIVDNLDIFELHKGDIIRVTAPGWHIKLIRWGEESFYKVLRDKLTTQIY